MCKHLSFSQCWWHNVIEALSSQLVLQKIAQKIKKSHGIGSDCPPLLWPQCVGWIMQISHPIFSNPSRGLVRIVIEPNKRLWLESPFCISYDVSIPMMTMTHRCYIMVKRCPDNCLQHKISSLSFTLLLTQEFAEIKNIKSGLKSACIHMWAHHVIGRAENKGWHTLSLSHS